jgi:sulfhydrogenase subunit beta (sulfur reductase)
MMAKQDYYLSNKDLTALVTKLLDDAAVIAPLAHNGRNILGEITAGTVKEINLAGFRAVEPFKSYLFKLTEKVSKYFGTDEPSHGKKLVWLGARGCDLEALEVYDKVLGAGDVTDPYYLANRKDLLIIGADCSDCGRTCFCNMVGGQPYPAKLYDLNLTPLEEGFVAEAGTTRGEALLAGLPQATAAQLQAKAAVRQKSAAKLEEINREFKCRCTIDWTEAHKINLKNQKAWRAVTKDCVECSACNFVCPSCTCFLLLDERGTGENSRHKVWDACLKAGYARVAGGANSRPKLYERLQNRYHCKFDYSFDRLGRYTCVGCGRCIDGCAGNIDMRQVYAELVRQAPLTAKLE